jgi:hypothetical protein
VNPLFAITKEEQAMLYAMIMILLLLWLIGMFTSTFMGGLIHMLLILAVLGVVVKMMSGKAV